MNSGQRLVVVDGVPETAQVLRAVFEPRGHQVDRVRAYELFGNSQARVSETRDSVLVLHDGLRLHDEEAARPNPEINQRVPRVIIGSLTAADSNQTHVGEQRLAQPFHYSELIRAVEALLVDEPKRGAA